MTTPSQHAGIAHYDCHFFSTLARESGRRYLMRTTLGFDRTNTTKLCWRSGPSAQDSPFFKVLVSARLYYSTIVQKQTHLISKEICFAMAFPFAPIIYPANPSCRMPSSMCRPRCPRLSLGMVTHRPRTDHFCFILSVLLTSPLSPRCPVCKNVKNHNESSRVQSASCGCPRRPPHSNDQGRHRCNLQGAIHCIMWKVIRLTA